MQGLGRLCRRLRRLLVLGFDVDVVSRGPVGEGVSCEQVRLVGAGVQQAKQSARRMG